MGGGCDLVFSGEEKRGARRKKEYADPYWSIVEAATEQLIANVTKFAKN